jgi:hypothetical protein
MSAAKSHRWDAEGDHCLDCGDSDWYAGPECTPKRPTEDRPAEGGGMGKRRVLETLEEAGNYIGCSASSPSMLREYQTARATVESLFNELEVRLAEVDRLKAESSHFQQRVIAFVEATGRAHRLLGYPHHSDEELVEAIGLLRTVLDGATPAPEPVGQREATQPVTAHDEASRLGDMGEGRRLSLVRECDGDFIVSVVQAGHRFNPESVQFCNSGCHSPHTHDALRALFGAMKADERGEPFVPKMPWGTHPPQPVAGVERVDVRSCCRCGAQGGNLVRCGEPGSDHEWMCRPTCAQPVAEPHSHCSDCEDEP